MPRRKQNLVLFFEEKEDARIIDAKLVRLYMNRFIINEDAQNEINGVYHLSNNRKRFIWSIDNGQMTIGKIKEDMFNIISYAINENCFHGQLSNIHLIIGYHFGLNWGWQEG